MSENDRAGTRYDGSIMAMVQIRERVRRGAATIALLCAEAAGAQPPPSDPLADLPVAPYAIGTLLDDNRPRTGQSRLSPLVAAPVAPDELRTYALVLRLSEAQQRFVRDAYLAYRAGIDKLYEHHNQPIADLSYAAADPQRPRDDWDYLDRLTKLRLLEREFNEELIALDDALLAGLQTILAEPQMERFERVQLRRQRQRCQPYTIMLARARIDLVKLVEQFVTDADVLGDLEDTLLEYEQRITPLYRRIDQISKRNDLEATRLVIAMNYAADGTTRLEKESLEAKTRQSEMLAKRAEVVGEAFPDQERIAAINVEMLPRILALVTEETGQVIAAEFQRLIYPQIHPDSAEPTTVFATIVEAEGINYDLGAAVREEVAAWRKRYDSITREMEESYDTHNREVASALAGSAFYQQNIKRLTVDRWDLAEQTLDRILSMLPADLQAVFAEPAQAYKRRLKMFRDVESGALQPYRPAPPPPAAPPKP